MAAFMPNGGFTASELPGRTKSYSSAFILQQHTREDESTSSPPRLLYQNRRGLSSGGKKKQDSPTNTRIPYTYRQVYPD